MAQELKQNYDAFISYRHNEWDTAVAKAIHRQLETYRIPGEIKNRTGKKRMGRVFRDQDELPLLADLGEGIRQALKASEWLIVICSPDLPLSKWCMAEVDFFISLGRRDRILTVLAAGEPAESFPPQLRFVPDETGALSEREPLAADVRAESLSKALVRVKNEKLRLLAPMLGVGYDDLRRRARERFLKNIVIGVGAVAAVTTAAGLYVLWQNVLLDEQKNIAQISQSRFLADLSGQELQKGDVRAASLLALEALPEDLNSPNRPFVTEAEYALRNLEVYRTSEGFRTVQTLPTRHDGYVYLNGDGTRLAHAGKDGSLTMYNTVNFSKLYESADIELSSNYCDYPGRFFDLNSRFGFAVNNRLKVWNVESGELLGEIGDKNSEIQAWDYLYVLRDYLVCYDDGTISLYARLGEPPFRTANIKDFPELAGTWENCAIYGKSPGGISEVWASVYRSTAVFTVNPEFTLEAVYEHDGDGVFYVPDNTKASGKRAMAWIDGEPTEAPDVSAYTQTPYSENVFDRKNDQIAVFYSDSAEVFDVLSREKTGEIQQTYGVYFAYPFFIGEDMLGALDSKTINVWNIRTGQLVASLPGGRRGGGYPTYQVYKNRIYTVSGDNILVYEKQEGTGCLNVPQPLTPNFLRLSQDGKFFAVGLSQFPNLYYGSEKAPFKLEYYSDVYIYKADTGENVMAETVQNEEPEFISWPGGNGSDRIFGHPSEKEARQYQDMDFDRTLKFQGVRARYLSQDNQYVVLKRWYGAEAVVLADETKRQSIEAYWTDLDVGAAHLSVFDKDNNKISVYAFGDLNVPVWTFQREDVKINRFGFSGNGQELLILEHDRTLNIFDAGSGELIWSHVMPDLRSFVVSEDLSKLLYYSADSAQLWSLEAKQSIMKLGGCTLAALSADGNRVFLCNNEEVQIWEITPLAELMESVRLQYEDNLFSPEERQKYFIN